MRDRVTSYQIVLKNCAFFARHGVFNEELRLGQRFYIDAVLQVNPGRALEDDNYRETVDYGAAYAEIKEVATGERFHLIEALALKIAKALHERFSQVTCAEITVRKPNAPVPGIIDYAEVCVVYPPQGEK
ncbi:MAG: dihydroneopterin aldolase [Pseudomonadota bacterium]